MRLSLDKSENRTMKIVLRRPSWPLIILDSLPACSKSRCPLLDGPEAQCILVTTLSKLSDDFCVGLPAKTRVPDHGSLREKEGCS
jgi:hypothetical protein